MKDFKKFLKSPFNLVTMAISMLPSFLLWAFPPAGSVSTWLFIAVTILCFIFLWLLIIVLINRSDNTNTEYINIINCNDNICLCSPSKYLTHDSIVSIYCLDAEYEDLIAYGIVTNIQGDGRIQVEPYLLPNTIIADDSKSIIDFIKSNRDKIVIKQIITRKIINNIHTI